MINKKGSKLIYGAVIFTILNVVVFSIYIGFVVLKSNDDANDEQAYAKQAALLIDSAKPGSEIEMDVIELLRLAEKNNFDLDNVVFVSNDRNEVRVQVEDGGGYVFPYFSDNFVEGRIDVLKRKFIFEVRNV